MSPKITHALQLLRYWKLFEKLKRKKVSTKLLIKRAQIVSAHCIDGRYEGANKIFIQVVEGLQNAS